MINERTILISIFSAPNKIKIEKIELIYNPIKRGVIYKYSNIGGLNTKRKASKNVITEEKITISHPFNRIEFTIIIPEYYKF